MTRQRKARFCISAGWILAASIHSLSRAEDYQPFDWVSEPPGTNVFMAYYELGTHSQLNNTITGTIKRGTNLDSNIAIARYLHYGEVFDHNWVFDFTFPVGALTNAQIAGQRLKDASGFADPIASTGYWFISQPDENRYLSAATFVTVPIGTYDGHRPLNMGGNRWQNDLQADFTQGFWTRYTIDIAADWICYGDNTKAGTGDQTLRQHSTYSAYLWLTRDITPEIRQLFPNALSSSVSVGYAGYFGGAQTLDDVPTGSKTGEQQVRVTYTQFITPTWEGLVSFNHDVAVQGQFKQDFGVLVRIAKVF